MGTHAKFSPSGAKRWFNCPGSLTLSAYVDGGNDDNEHSVEGTAAHALVAYCLENQVDPFSLIGMNWYKDIPGYPDEAIRNLGIMEKLNAKRQETVDDIGHMVYHCLEISEAAPENAMIEAKVIVEGIGGHMWGTGDYIFHDIANNELHVVDYKNGFDPVPATDPQLLIYAQAACDTLRIQPGKIHTTVVQPRIGAPYKRTHTRTWGEMKTEFHAYREVALQYMENPVQETKPGTWCKWCRAKPICAKFQAQQADTPDASTDEDLKRAMARIPSIEMWVKDIKKRVYNRLMNGAKPKDVGGVLNETSPHRKFRDVSGDGTKLNDAAKAEFGDRAFTAPEVKSPAQLEKLPGGKAFVQEWSYKPKGSLVLAGLDSKKPHVTPQATKDRLTAIAEG
jgi:hypothetical protein